MRHFRPVTVWKSSLQATVLFLLTLSAACGSGGGDDPPCCGPQPEVDIAQALVATAGVSSLQEKSSTVAGTRFFVCTFRQPVDHANGSGPSFEQTFTLLYRSRTAPVVLATTG